MMLCSFWVEWLEGLHHGTSRQAHEQHMWQQTGRGGFSGPVLVECLGPVGKHVFRPAFMISAITLCFELRSSASMRRVMEKTVRLLSPSWSAALQDLFRSMHCIAPSAGTLSKHRLMLDAAYMLFMRDEHQQMLLGDTAFYNMLDSSPQGRYNYEIFEYTALHENDLVNCMECVEAVWGCKDM